MPVEHDQIGGEAANARVLTGPGASASGHVAGRRRVVVAAAAGFIGGVVFWHFVGFWSVVSHAMLGTDDAKPAQRSRPAPVAQTVTNRTGAFASGSAPAAAPAGGAVAKTDEAAAPTLADLLQCSEARRAGGSGPASVKACPPLRQRLPSVDTAVRGDRQLDAREAAERLARGWATGVSRIETGSLQASQ